MPRHKTILDESLYEKVEIALKEISDSDIVLKLLSIKALRDHKYEEISSIFGISRISLTTWIKSFKESGIDGLISKAKGHRQSKLNKEQLEEIETWIIESKDSQGQDINWTIPKLMIKIDERFGIKISHTPLWLQLKKMGMRIKSPRPMHKQSNTENQEDFKKKLE